VNSPSTAAISSPASGAGYEAYRARTHFGNLDGLRFVCIFAVLWHHYSPIPNEGIRLLNRGFLGVDFFFVLSGFLITTLILREIDTYGNFSLRDFYLRRIVRIVPVYYFVVTCVGAYFIFVQGRTQYLDLWPYYYLFLSNFLIEDIPLLSITWSLSVEEQYYMIWPLILLLFPARYLWLICLAFVAINVLGILGVFGFSARTAGSLVFKLPSSTYAPIILGSLAALLLHKPTSFAALNRLAGGYWSVLLGAIGLALIIHLAPGDLRGFPNLAIHLAMTFVLIALVVRENTVLTPVLTLPPIARVGVVSYGMYLYHLIALYVVWEILGGAVGGLAPWPKFICYFGLAYLMAEASFHTLEKWFRRFRPKKRTPPASKGGT
jgi:peptidoglycan/LPS O-acetylase OafA/YrhL